MMDQMVDQVSDINGAIWKVNMIFILNRSKRLFEPIGITYSGIPLDGSLYRHDRDFYPVQLHTKNEVLHLQRDGAIIG